MNNFPADFHFLQSPAKKRLIAAIIIIALVYFFLIAFWFEQGNRFLFWLLMAGQAFYLWMIFTYAHTIWRAKEAEPPGRNFSAPVDVFITVAGEPVEIVEKTAQAALDMNYPNFQVYILNDGYVAKKENWKDIQALGKKLKVRCLTRKKAGGAKAGNINSALLNTWRPFIAIFDADQIPHKDFLQKTMDYFADPLVGFVQSPQYYKNHNVNYIAGTAWEQQKLFFGPICIGKNSLNSVFMCGTNMILRRKAVMEAGGMCETNVAEDFLTSLFMHEYGWKSVYVPDVLAEGLAPEDFLSYNNQQLRWARGSLEIIFRYNPLFRSGTNWHQKIQYLASASYYLSGTIVLLHALLPLIFFFTGLVPLQISSMTLAAVFLPYIFLIVVLLHQSSNYAYTYRAVAFSMSSFFIHMQALVANIFRMKSVFSITSKRRLKGNFLYLAIPHILYLLAVVAGLFYALMREGLSASVINNGAWALFYSAIFIPFIAAAWSPAAQPATKEVEVLSH